MAFYLQRYLNAQQSGGIYDNMSTYETALQEIRDGHKRTHWMWYVFPQMKGLGHSELSEFYGINGREEAYAYIEHPTLRERLIEATEATMHHNVYSRTAVVAFDNIKKVPCLTTQHSQKKIR